MSQKKEKRERKMLRENMREYREDMKQIMLENSKIIKPKPKYIPMTVWLWAMGFFIKIKDR